MESTLGQRVSSGVLACVVSLAMLAIGMQWGRHQGSPTTLQTVRVHQGDTLWSIAGRASCGVDPRETIAILLRLNHLDSPVIQPGQELVVPAAARCG